MALRRALQKALWQVRAPCVLAPQTAHHMQQQQSQTAAPTGISRPHLPQEPQHAPLSSRPGAPSSLCSSFGHSHGTLNSRARDLRFPESARSSAAAYNTAPYPTTAYSSAAYSALGLPVSDASFRRCLLPAPAAMHSLSTMHTRSAAQGLEPLGSRAASSETVPRLFAAGSATGPALGGALFRRRFASGPGKKKTKIKPYSSLKRRFKILASGEIKRWRAGKRHNASTKTPKQRRQLRRPSVVSPGLARPMRLLNFHGKM